MYVAMNRFKVAAGSEEAFETLWRERDSHLDGTAGFLEFRMLRGAAGKGHTLYISQSRWRDEGAFRDWMKSDSFRKAHKDAADHRDLYLGPPDFEGLQAVDDI